MKKVVFGIVLGLVAMLIFFFWNKHSDEKTTLTANTALLQKELLNVSKLIVNEGNFVDVYKYSNSKELFGEIWTSEKKALVVVNAKVIISYDLKQIEYDLDEQSKTLFITKIPDPEIDINPDIEYYDVTSDYLNPFSAEDYNTIKKNIMSSLKEKVKASSLEVNAKDRLISELSKFYVLTQSMGWTLVYNNNTITTPDDFALEPQANLAL